MIKIGDRRQVHFTRESIWLFTKWDGTALPIVVQNALKRKQGSWHYAYVLLRVVFSEMIQNDVLSGRDYALYHQSIETDYDDEDVEIDTVEKTVRIGTLSWRFEEYIEQAFDGEC